MPVAAAVFPVGVESLCEDRTRNGGHGTSWRQRKRSVGEEDAQSVIVRLERPTVVLGLEMRCSVECGGRIEA
jgi:hypothetical protein